MIPTLATATKLRNLAATGTVGQIRKILNALDSDQGVDQLDKDGVRGYAQKVALMIECGWDARYTPANIDTMVRMALNEYERNQMSLQAS